MKTAIYFLIILVFFSCKREVEKTHIEKEEIDSIVVLKDKNNKINCIYRFSNEKEKVLNELISFTKNGKIDYAKSNFAEIVGNDLIFHSQYDKKYRIPDKRFLEFIGTKIINQSDSVQIIKLDTIFFSEDSRIENYKKNLPPYGKILETIFLDTIIKEKNKLNKTIIRTIEYKIDLRNLLIERTEETKKNSYSH